MTAQVVKVFNITSKTIHSTFSGGSMRGCKWFILFSIMALATVAFSQTPAVPVLWVYGANHGAPYSGVEIVDTEAVTQPFFTWHPGFGIDTTIEEIHINGTSFNDSIVSYFSYDYQFTDSVLWSGFKLCWEARGFTWDVRGYDFLSLDTSVPCRSIKWISP